MNKQIESVVNTFRAGQKSEVFIEIVAACAAWLKLTHDNKLDDNQRFTGEASIKELINILNDCVDVNFSPEKWKIEDQMLAKLLNSLNDLIKAKVVTFHELSIAIKQLLASQNHQLGTLIVPNEITELGASFIGSNINSVYCPYSSGYEFSESFPESVEKFGETNNQSEVFYAAIHGLLNDKTFNLESSDPIYSPSYIGEGGLRQFDASISMPPFGLKIKASQINDIWGRFPEQSLMGEVYFLRHMLAQTTQTVVCFVSNGFLFRTSAGEKQFKQDMIANNWVKAVVALPSHLLPNTSVPISALILDKQNTADMLTFIDASGEEFSDKSSRTRSKLVNTDKIMNALHSKDDTQISVRVSAKQVIANDYNLSPARYVLSEDEKALAQFLASHQTAKLEDLVDIIRPQAVKHDDAGVERFTEYNVSNLNDIGQISKLGKVVNVLKNDLNRAEKQTIQQNDVLVVCKGAVGKVGVVETQLGPNAIASQAFSILRVKPHINSITPTALFQYLNSKYGQLQLASLVTGTTALMLSAKDLSSMLIPLLPENKIQQANQVRTSVIEAFKQIEQAKLQIKTLNEDYL